MLEKFPIQNPKKRTWQRFLRGFTRQYSKTLIKK